MAKLFYSQSSSTTDTSSFQLAAQAPKSNQVVIPACWGLAIVEAVIGYEWLLSALDKLFSSVFRVDFLLMLQRASSPDNPNGWWVTFIHRLVLPYAQPWAILIEIAEVLVALGFFTGSVLWTRRDFPVARWTRRLTVCVLLAILGGVLMTVNYYVMAGKTFPGLNLGDPFDEGLSLDGLLTGIGVGLFIIHLMAYWSQKRSSIMETQDQTR